MKERLQKILSRYGVASRRTAEKLIEAGVVTVNGKIASLGESADADSDIISVDGEVLVTAPEKKYIVLYKPRGYVTTMKDERGRRSVNELVESCGTRVYPVGRLDLNSEGLVIMTNDGDVAMNITHPSKEVEKVYRVTVRGTDIKKIDKLMLVDEIDGEDISPPKVTVLKTGTDRMSLEIIIHEGKNRQIRRMCDAVGLEVLRLKRNRVGEIGLGGLKPGEWREMGKDEVRYIKSLKKDKPYGGKSI